MFKHLVIICALISTAAHAALDFDSFEKIRSDLRSKKYAIVMENMALPPKQEAVFAPIYKEYNQKVMDVRDKRFALIRRYSEHLTLMTDALAADLANQIMSLQKKRNQLSVTYFKKVSKALSPVAAIRFLQIENQYSVMLNMVRVQEIPLVKTPKEMARQFGLKMTTKIDTESNAVMDTKMEESMNKRMQE